MNTFEYIVCFIIAAALPAVLVWYYNITPWVFLASAIIVLAFPLIMQMFTKKGSELNPLLGKTALMLLIYCALLGTGLLL